MAASDLYEQEKQAFLAEVEKWLSPSATWKETKETKGVTTKRADHPEHSMNVFYGSKLFEHSLERLHDQLWNITEEKVKEFDPETKLWRFVEIGDEQRVVYQVNKFGWPVWDRSFVTLWYLHRPNEDRVMHVYGSVEHGDFPEQPKADVRGVVTFLAEVLTKQPDGKVLFERVMHVDPKGSLPAGLINSLAGRQVVDFLLYLEKQLNKGGAKLQ